MHHLPCLLLIRHAQSENNALEDRFRVPDPGITELGVANQKNWLWRWQSLLQRWCTVVHSFVP